MHHVKNSRGKEGNGEHYLQVRWTRVGTEGNDTHFLPKPIQQRPTRLKIRQATGTVRQTKGLTRVGQGNELPDT